ncbi:hypothetical protein FMGBMHLM_3115 [Methylobacterium aerolatum]|uniref:hypothetical protein n=1 Tax=Methylobacterium aerolatum TaxID=418708 RepID=UPI00207E2019|nr:hypothetical protein FMGBMHLM_3115 [Methylobacterium aerolatum]
MATYPVYAGDLAVCVAINDNDNAWYEMLVPFLLSLRQTNYTGYVCVIGFGLSQHKIDLLRANSVNVIESAEKSLAVARYMEVSRLCEANPGLRKVALYDADIWFCHPHFDLFDAIEGDNIFACRDQMFCTFITDQLIGPNKDENMHLVYYVGQERMGGAVQAGLVAGTTEAWRDFSRFVRASFERVGTDFTLSYGLDTTLLQLWAGHGRVNRLSELQNFVTKYGLAEVADAAGEISFHGADGPIRGLHMTGDIRFTHRWRYFTNNRDNALEKGHDLELKQTALVPWSDIPDIFRDALASAGFEVVSMTVEEGGSVHAFRIGEDLHIIGAGNHELVMRAAKPFPRLILDTMYYSNAPSPIRARMKLNTQEVTLSRNESHWISMAMGAGTDLTLISESLRNQGSKIIWIFSGGIFHWQ